MPGREKFHKKIFAICETGYRIAVAIMECVRWRLQPAGRTSRWRTAEFA